MEIKEVKFEKWRVICPTPIRDLVNENVKVGGDIHSTIDIDPNSETFGEVHSTLQLPGFEKIHF